MLKTRVKYYNKTREGLGLIFFWDIVTVIDGA